jgi:glycosyltransferase involved in cell wall biosynthesis
MPRLTIVIPMLRVHQDAPGGSTRLAWDEAVHLAGKGHDVWLVAADVVGGMPEREEREGVHVLRYAVPDQGAADPRRASAHQRATRTLLERHVTGPVDVIHGHAPLTYAGALGIASPRTRLVYTVHSPAALESLAAEPQARGVARLRLRARATFLRRIERRFLGRTRVIHVLSAYTRRLLEEEHALAPVRVTRIPGWVDLERFGPAVDVPSSRRSLGWPEGRVLFTLRRLVPRMGLDRLLRAFSEVRKSVSDVSLVIAGEGPLRKSLESLASDLGLQESVRFEGRVPDEALPRMYAAADVFVLPTAELECFGLIALEAFASGRPVLATPVGAIPEVVGGVEPLWLASDGGVPALTRLLCDWLAGRLPAHAPAELRAVVARDYSQERRLSELIRAALGGEP